LQYPAIRAIPDPVTSELAALISADRFQRPVAQVIAPRPGLLTFQVVTVPGAPTIAEILFPRTGLPPLFVVAVRSNVAC